MNKTLIEIYDDSLDPDKICLSIIGQDLAASLAQRGRWKRFTAKFTGGDDGFGKKQKAAITRDWTMRSTTTRMSLTGVEDELDGVMRD